MRFFTNRGSLTKIKRVAFVLLAFSFSSTLAHATATDTLVLHLSEDAYKGDAQFIASVDGVALTSAAQTILVHQPTGGSQDFAYTGNWGPGTHKVSINFTNDAWDGTAATDGHDRNIFVNSMDYDGVHSAPGIELVSTGATSFTVSVGAAHLDTLVLHLSEDAYNGDVQFIASIDGKALTSAPQTILVHQPSGLSQDFSYVSSWGSGPHTVSIDFLNDAWDGNASSDGHDRNLFIAGVTYDAVALTSGTWMYSSGSSSLSIPSTASVVVPPAACNGHASGSSYSLILSSTAGTSSAGLNQCPYGGTQPVTTTITQNYTCTNGVQTAVGSATSTVVMNGSPTCKAGASCNGYASGSTYPLTVSATNSVTTASASDCPYGGTQAITTTVTQDYLCTNGSQSAVGGPVSSVASAGSAVCTPAVNGVCGNPNGTTPSSAPGYMLCNKGNASAVSGNGPWTWACAGSFGGKTAQCEAQPRFAIGSNTGWPDAWNAANEANFETTFRSFAALMDVPPQYIGGAVDSSQPVSSWIGSASEQAQSNARSPYAKNLIEVLGMPMYSTAAGSPTPDQQLQAFAAGTYDATIVGVVQAWQSQGYKLLHIRLGWEMNLPGTPGYAGDDAQTQADWVAAFKHMYTVFHQTALAQGVDLSVMWNPGTTNYSNAMATTNLYPGDAYVDIIGVDAYSDMGPYTDSSDPLTYHDWDTGAEDISAAQFMSDPVNRIHYWNYPSANKWTNDGSNGHSQSVESIVQFALDHKKPFAVPECGAGNSPNDVSDDPTYPQWLAQLLGAAQAQGLSVLFVNPWDENMGGSYQFSGGMKPLEGAAWAQYFGSGATVTYTR